MLASDAMRFVGKQTFFPRKQAALDTRASN